MTARPTSENPGIGSHVTPSKVVRNMDLSKQEQKQKEIKREMAKLKKLLANLSADKRKATEGLIQEAAFMHATLGELREIIDRDGPIDLFEQGDNAYHREHPAVKSYNTMIQRYSTVMKQLLELLPNESAKEASDELIEFVKRARK